MVVRQLIGAGRLRLSHPTVLVAEYDAGLPSLARFISRPLLWCSRNMRPRIGTLRPKTVALRRIFGRLMRRPALGR